VQYNPGDGGGINGGDRAPGSYGGGKLETGKGRELIADHVIGLRRSGAVKLSNKGWMLLKKAL
jgi:hypothetical protein